VQELSLQVKTVHGAVKYGSNTTSHHNTSCVELLYNRHIPPSNNSQLLRLSSSHS